MRRLASLLLVVLVTAVVAGCDAGDADGLADEGRRQAEELRERTREARTRVERLRDRLRRRVQETLDRLERAVPAAPADARPPRRGDASLEAFLTEVLSSVDGYWTTTFRASGLPEPRVAYLWVPAGDRVFTGCAAIADDDAALYCPRDDTIYVAQEFARGVLEGIRDDFPGTRAGRGRAIGAWGASVYRAGKLKPGDVEEALGTAQAVGDFEYLDPQHHGTPDERRDAWLRGFRGGDPSVCREFVPR